MRRKSSKQRDIILRYIQSVPRHMSAEEIFHAINVYEKISLATIYRNLNILVEMNEIRKIAHPIDGYLYDRITTIHYHLHCTTCNRIFDMETPYMEELNKKLEANKMIKVQEHMLTAVGTCDDCLKHQSTEKSRDI